MVRKRFAFIAIAGAAVSASPALAQETRRLDIGLHASVMHDTNIARSSDALAASRGITPEDTVYTPSVSIDLLMPLSRQSVFLRGSAGYDFHQENDRLDSERMDLSGGLNSRLGSCQGTFSAGYSRYQSDLQELTLLDPENTIEARRVAIDAICGREIGLALRVGGGREVTDNSNAVQMQADYESSTANAGLIYRRPTFGTLMLSGTYQKIEYPNRILAIAGSNGFEVRGVGITFERKIGSRLQGVISFAQTEVEPLSPLPGLPAKFDGSTYSGDLTYRPTSRLEAQLQYERAIRPSTRIGRLYDVSELTRLEGRYRIGSRITLALGGQVSDVDSDGILPPAATDLTNARTELGFGSVQFQQSKRLALRLAVAREERKTNSPRFDYDSTRVTFSTDVRF